MPMILIEAPSSAYRRGMLVVGEWSLRRGGDRMRFDTQQPKRYCGIDLQARPMSVCLLRQGGEVMVHQNFTAHPETFLQVIAPYRDTVVVAVECLFTWYGLADLGAREGIPVGLGHALYRKAIPGGKAKNARLEAPKVAGLLRGGRLPQA
jgi:hypothetical protein